MQLPREQTKRFYRIWLALLHHVNDQLHLVPAFPCIGYLAHPFKKRQTWPARSLLSLGTELD
jgi:hypothetical protein